MKFLKDTNWQEVFSNWRNREANDPDWIECATKVKGWPNWESWRSFTAQQIGAVNRTWKIYRFDRPLEEVPELLVGPFGSWQDRVINKNNTTFRELLENPSQYDQFSNHARILGIMKAFPFAIELIGLVRKDINKLVCLEGHHSATAMSICQKRGQPIDFSKTPITIALAELSANETSLLEVMTRRGTTKNPPS